VRTTLCQQKINDTKVRGFGVHSLDKVSVVCIFISLPTRALWLIRFCLDEGTMEDEEPATQYSPSSTAGSRKNKHAKTAAKKPEMNIEEVFASVSNVQASGLNPPPARTVLTPRSAEACLKHGINPEILRIRDLESFYGRL
jgi:hypothetical protein